MFHVSIIIAINLISFFFLYIFFGFLIWLNYPKIKVMVLTGLGGFAVTLFNLWRKIRNFFRQYMYVQ